MVCLGTVRMLLAVADAAAAVAAAVAVAVAVYFHGQQVNGCWTKKDEFLEQEMEKTGNAREKAAIGSRHRRERGSGWAGYVR